MRLLPVHKGTLWIRENNFILGCVVRYEAKTLISKHLANLGIVGKDIVLSRNFQQICVEKKNWEVFNATRPNRRQIPISGAAWSIFGRVVVSKRESN